MVLSVVMLCLGCPLLVLSGFILLYVISCFMFS